MGKKEVGRPGDLSEIIKKIMANTIIHHQGGLLFQVLILPASLFLESSSRFISIRLYSSRSNTP
jgi:hypothetical protein